MSDSTDPQLRIRAIIDPSGADAGAGQVTDDLNNVVDATKDTGDAAEEMGSKFDDSALENRRNLMHLAHGFVELKEGGANAFAGLATEAYLAGEAMDVAMGPVGIALLGISILIPVLTRAWGDHKQALGDNKEAAEDLAKKFEDVQKRIVDAVNQGAAALKAELDASNALTTQIQEDATLDVGHVKSLEAGVEATQRLQIAQLELQKQNELGAATDEEQKKAIEDKYKALEASVTAATAAKKNDLEQQAAEIEIQSKGAQLNRQKMSSEENSAKLQGLQDKADQAAGAAGLGGASADQIAAALKIAMNELADKQAQFNAVVQAETQQRETVDELKHQAELGSVLAGFMLRSQETKLQRDKQAIDDASDAVAEAAKRFSDVRAADAAQEALAKQGGELIKANNDLADSIKKLTAELQDKLSGQRDLKTEEQAIGLENKAKAKEIANQTADDQAAAVKADEKKQRDAQIKAVEEQEAAPREQIKSLEDQLRKSHEAAQHGHELVGKMTEAQMQKDAAQLQLNDELQTKLSAQQDQLERLQAQVTKLKHF